MKNRRVLLRTPWKDTSAFSVMQDMSFWLNSAIRVNGSSGMLKLSREFSNSRGSALPKVALWPLISVVTQLASPSTVHCEPVYPFVQTQEHVVSLETLMPPFLQGVVCSHCSPLSAFCWGTATRKTGSRTARATTISTAADTIAKTLGRIPQQRRWRFSPVADRVSSDRILRCPDFLNKTGQDERPSEATG